MALLNSENTIKHLHLFAKGVGIDIQKLITAINSKKNDTDYSLLSDSMTFEFIYTDTLNFDVQLWHKYNSQEIMTTKWYSSRGVANFHNAQFFTFSNGDNVKMKLSIGGNLATLGYTIINYTKELIYTGTVLSQETFTDFKIEILSK